MADFKKMDRLLQEFADKTVPGCACTIMKNEEILYEGYAGYADIDTKKPVQSNSMFRQASTTKLFTYAIIGMLYEEGRFLLSDPISEFLPEWKNMKKFQVNANNVLEIVPLENPITIKDVVTMACGLPYCMVPDVNSKQPVIAAMSKALAPLMGGKCRPTLRDEVRAISQVPVLFEPGTHWLYGFGSEITGAIVEEITGKPLRRVFEERVIEPLGLKDTATYITDQNRQQLVSDYLKDAGSFTKLPPESDAGNLEEYTPEGARVTLMCSSRDFALFMQMLANGGVYKGKQLLGRKTVDLLRTNYLNEAQLKDFNCTYLAGYGYGLGFRTVMDQAAGNHNGSLGAFGWTGGSGIWVEADPKEGISIAYMHNMRPNEELYHHLRVRTVAYGCLD